MLLYLLTQDLTIDVGSGGQGESILMEISGFGVSMGHEREIYGDRQFDFR